MGEAGGARDGRVADDDAVDAARADGGGDVEQLGTFEVRCDLEHKLWPVRRRRRGAPGGVYFSKETVEHPSGLQSPANIFAIR